MLTTAFYFLERGSNYYLYPVYPTMFVVGAVWSERLDVLVTRGWIVLALGVIWCLRLWRCRSSIRLNWLAIWTLPTQGPTRSRPPASARH